jgi:phage tail sheath protein FI
MANLVSPGISVTVTDESFFIPAAGRTVPLFFIATAAEKTQPNNLAALGTYEHDVIRTVTSLTQSIQLYGIPRFLQDSQGRQHHGDARNEYGLFALNSYLGIGNLAYVIRANVNLNDNLDDIRTMWNNKAQEASFVLENLVAQYIEEYNIANGYVPLDPLYKETVTGPELLSLTQQATAFIWDMSTFKNVENDFFDDHTATPYDVYANGYDQPSTGTFIGYQGNIDDWIANLSGSTSGKEDQWTPTEAANFLLANTDQLQFTVEFRNQTSLGANNAARRAAIVTALQASINNNTDIRGEAFEYNLILCPGFPEVVDEMLNLCVDIQEEAFVIGDVPFTQDPDQVVSWAATPNRITSRNVAYYYPHGFGSNLDGVNVVVPASAIAVRTIAYSDNVSELWFAPAGTRRGVVSGVSLVGYVTGTLGTPTTFVDVALNQGQRENLYKYFTNINPIVFFPTRGLIVFGQKTSAPDASALDRINVMRLVMYIKRQLRKNTLSFVFEPNDQLTRDSLKAVVDNFLGDLVVKRALYDFATVCDESNNTPDRIDKNEMYIDIALKPVKAAEFIYIPIRIVATNAEI